MRRGSRNFLPRPKGEGTNGWSKEQQPPSDMALPDLIEIVPLTRPVKAEITVPGSKSITNRALILAALADGATTLKGALWSEDTQIMGDCLKELGAARSRAGAPETHPLDLFVGNAGTATRFLAPFLCLGSGVYRLHGVPRMYE